MLVVTSSFNTISNATNDLTKTQLSLLFATPLAIGLLVAVYNKPRITNAHGLAVHRPDSALPVIGSTLSVMKNRHRFTDWLQEESEKIDGNPWVLEILGSPPLLVVTSPSYFEEILHTKADIFDKGKDSQLMLHDLFGKGIINSDGLEWQWQRKTASHLFSMRMLRDTMEAIVQEKLKEFCLMLDTYARSGKQISLKERLVHLTADIFTKIGFGVELGSIQAGLDGKSTEFVSSIRCMSRVTNQRLTQPTFWWRLRRFLRIGEEKECVKSRDYMKRFLTDVIQRAIERRNNALPNQKASDYDLLSLFLNSKYRSETNIRSPEESAKQLRDFCMNFFLGGQGTSSTSLCWFIVQMNRHPDVLDKIRAEMRAKAPALLHENATIPTAKDIASLTYLEAAVRENLRMNAVIPYMVRHVEESTTLQGGEQLDKGCDVLIGMYQSMRMEEHWGEDALEFKPERWLDESGKLRSMSVYKFIPFSAGARLCIGKSLAMMELKHACAVILSKFDICIEEDPWQVTYETAIGLTVKGNLMTTIKKADHTKGIA